MSSADPDFIYPVRISYSSVTLSVTAKKALFFFPVRLAKSRGMQHKTHTPTHADTHHNYHYYHHYHLHHQQQQQQHTKPVRMFVIESLKQAQIKNSQSDAVNVISLSLYEAPAKVQSGRLLFLHTWAWSVFLLPSSHSLSLSRMLAHNFPAVIVWGCQQKVSSVLISWSQLNKSTAGHLTPTRKLLA